MTLVAAAFLWGVAEATLFFLVPDVLVASAAALRPGEWPAFAAAALAGSFAGGLVTFAVARTSGESYSRLVTWLPSHTPAYLAFVRQDVRLGGAKALATAAFLGRPFKLLTFEAASSGKPGAVRFFLVTGLARAARFFLAAFLGSRVPGAGSMASALGVLAVALALSAAFLVWVERRFPRAA